MSSQHPAEEKELDEKAIVAFCEYFLVLETNMNLACYLQLEEMFMQRVFMFCTI